MCGWERTASDDAIDRGLIAIEAFIDKNATDPWTPGFVESVKKREAEASLSADVANLCERDPGNLGSSIEFIHMLRTQPPGEISASLAELVSIPREPVRNPCL